MFLTLYDFSWCRSFSGNIVSYAVEICDVTAVPKKDVAKMCKLAMDALGMTAAATNAVDLVVRMEPYNARLKRKTMNRGGRGKIRIFFVVCVDSHVRRLVSSDVCQPISPMI